jgi:hypothetical protein
VKNFTLKNTEPTCEVQARSVHEGFNIKQGKEKEGEGKVVSSFFSLLPSFFSLLPLDVKFASFWLCQGLRTQNSIVNANVK